VSDKRIKKHHFVPKVLQKAFRAEGDHIWYSSRGSDGRFGDVEDRNIESTFRVKDLYTVLDDDDILSDEIEREFYGRIDDYLGRMLPKVLDGLDSGKVPTFSSEALISLRLIVFEMIKRTPDFTNKYDDVEIGKDFVEDMLESFKENPDPERQSAFENALSNQTKLKQLGRTIKVRGVILNSDMVSDAMAEFVPRWAVIEGKQSFILSSMIAYRIGNGGHNGLANPNMEIWMPIAPKYAIVLLQDPEGKIPHRVDEPRDHVRQVNEFAVRSSRYVASHSSKLLRSLVLHGGTVE
jgi:hypothetical protein